jgi:2-polyprenyl-3-methyl-5-hydroxy-6-metoxy-1,4-benzoquinol methylase
MTQDAEAAWTLDDITDRGERVVHLRTDEGFYDHLSVYHFASQYCKDRTVLDAGSGTGYGAAYLADHGAERVFGIDISPKAIEFSQAHFQRPNLQFDTMSLEHINGFPYRSFDVITSSNTLEHLTNVSAFLRTAWELLNPQGMMIVAVPPITDDFLFAVNIANPYHLNIWSPTQWAAVFRRYFGQAKYFTHNRIKPQQVTSNTNEPWDPSKTEYVFDAIPFDQMLTTHSLSSTFILSQPVAADQLPDSNEPIVFVDDSFTRSAEDRTTAIIAQIMLHREHLIVRLNQSLTDQQAQIRQFEALIDKKNKHIIDLESLLQRIESRPLLRLLRWLKPRAG